MLLWIFWTLSLIDLYPLFCNADNLASPYRLKLVKANERNVYGCRYLNLCKPTEKCYNDGLFGVCNDGSYQDIDLEVDGIALAELNDILARLDERNYGWADEFTQCIWNVFFKTFAPIEDEIYEYKCSSLTKENIEAAVPKSDFAMEQEVKRAIDQLRSRRRSEDASADYQVDNAPISLNKYEIVSTVNGMDSDDAKEKEYSQLLNSPRPIANFKSSFKLQKKNDYLKKAKVDGSVFNRLKLNTRHTISSGPSDYGYIVTSVILCGALLVFALIIVGIYCSKRFKYRKEYFRHEHESKMPFGDDDPTSSSSGIKSGAVTTIQGSGEDMDSLFGATDTYKEMFRHQKQELSDIVKGTNDASGAVNNSVAWNGESVVTNMDISTGHAILSYMEQHFCNKDKLEAEWQNICSYETDAASSRDAALMDVNKPKNRYIDVLPYDNNRVKLKDVKSDYINATKIVDDDPTRALYIATQGPLAQTAAHFWTMIWQQDVYVIVNLTCLMEAGIPMCHKYWPDEGCEVFNNFEVHLVSEHVQCDAYLVRSFFIKNRFDGQTRTITQFHFVCWPDLDVPQNCKVLLDFRRKVNKSFRNKNSPIVVHCNDGCGRTGTYIVLDMILNRLNRGVKEIDVAACLEHLRDQRMDLVKTMEQFQFVLTAIAEEVHEALKYISCQ